MDDSDSSSSARWRAADFDVERTLRGSPQPALVVRWRPRAATFADARGRTASARTMDDSASIKSEATLAAEEAALPAPDAEAVRDPSDVEAQRDALRALGCDPPEQFDEVGFDGAGGARFLVYVRSGRVLRASRYDEQNVALTAADEESLATDPVP